MTATAAVNVVRADRESAPHALSAPELFGQLQSSPDGLTDAEARGRRKPVETHVSGRVRVAVGALAESLFEPLQLLLVAVGVLAAIFGELRDAIAIFVIITLVAAVE